MKYISFINPDGHSGFGATDGTDIYGLGGDWTDLSDLANSGELGHVLIGPRTHLQLNEVTLRPPLPRPGKVFCVGVNYPDRNAEYRDGSDQPQYMSLFPRYISGFVGHRENLVRPPESEQLDYEGEIVIVIGQGGRRIRESAAYDHIAAVSLCNEGTLRDWVRHAKFNVTQGKNWDRSGAMGPWLVPFTGPELIEGVDLTTTVNGQVRQRDNTARMMFSFRKIIAYISTFCTLHPGDMIVTGTPTGAGARLDPPQWLKPGDRVEVNVPTIGTLINGVEDEVQGEAQDEIEDENAQ